MSLWSGRVTLAPVGKKGRMSFPGPKPTSREVAVRLLSVGVGGAILASLWRAVNPARVLDALARADAATIAAGFALLVPAILAAGWRLRALAPHGGRPSLRAAIALVLAASALNQALPAKVGDLAKAWWLAAGGGVAPGRALALVAVEKLVDLAALLVLAALGLLALRPATPIGVAGGAIIAAGLATIAIAFAVPAAATRPLTGLASRLTRFAGAAALADAWHEARTDLLSRPRHLVAVAGASLVVWGALLGQVWTFARALGADLPLSTAFALAPIAFVIGLVPISFAGIGTRDAALVVVFAGHLAPPVAAALGVLLSARYLLTGVLGLPFCVLGPLAGRGQPAAATR